MLKLPADQGVEAANAPEAPDKLAFAASATDAVTAKPVIRYYGGIKGKQITSSYVFGLGTTTVTVTATDAAGNVSLRTFTITVLANSAHAGA